MCTTIATVQQGAVAYVGLRCRHTALAFRLQVRKIILDIIFQVWRDGALVERLASSALVLRQLLLVGHL